MVNIQLLERSLSSSAFRSGEIISHEESIGKSRQHLKKPPCYQLVSLYNTRWSLYHSKVDQYSTDVVSNCIYGFTCTCYSKVIRRTKRGTSKRFSEYVPWNLQEIGGKTFKSAIPRHF